MLLLAIVSGGSSQADSTAFQLFRLLCVCLMAASLARLLSVRPSTTEALALLLILAGVVLVVLQLVPLPFGLFASLPGRELVAKVFSIAEIPARAMPMTLSPNATTQCLLALMPPIAFFLATLSVDQQARHLLASSVVLGTLANVVLGLAQRFQGSRSGLYLYEITNYGSATGFFSNRNNFAMLLCVAIPLLWAVVHRVVRQRLLSPVVAISGGGIALLVIVMGLAASNSRSGITLGMLALTLSALMILSASASTSDRTRGRRRSRLVALAVLGGALVIGQFGMVGILRVVESDPLTDYRSEIRGVTLRAAADFFPLGSGFGTFRPIYAMYETPATMVSAFVNHAHNDWLELWLEGGVPAAALMAAALMLFAYQALRLWIPRGAYAQQVLPRAASVGVLVLLLHSMVEYPLRMPSLACVFATLAAIMMCAPTRPVAHVRSVASSGGPRATAATKDTGPAAGPGLVTPPRFRVARTEAEGPGGPPSGSRRPS